MKVVTVVTDLDHAWFINLFLPSVKMNNLDLEVLNPASYETHRSRDKVLYKYLKTLKRDEIILCTDAYDVAFVSTENEILQKYNAFGKPIVFASETNCFPDATLAAKYPLSQSAFKYLNGGGFIGRVGYIMDFILEVLVTPSIKRFSWSNQVYWTEQFLRNQDKIGLDTNCEIFSTLSSQHDMEFINTKRSEADIENFSKKKKAWFDGNFEFNNKRLVFKPKKTQPCHIHVNGFSKVLLPEIEEHLIKIVS
jgi:hypothetical protein